MSPYNILDLVLLFPGCCWVSSQQSTAVRLEGERRGPGAQG